ncbi:MAG: M14 family metallopeptidase [Gemmatimonadaceae bacterium]
MLDVRSKRPTRLPLAAALLVCLAASLGAQNDSDARPTFSVGTATARRGEMATGVIAVPAGVDAALSIPVIVVHGARPGPVLALVAGSHGTEYASIIALEKLIPRIDPKTLRGTVIIVPLINIPSFQQKIAHVNPVDKKSMNRFYPGDLSGTQTERASYLITKQVVEPSDHLIDLHGGDIDENLRPYSYWTVTGNTAQDSISRQMVLAFGLDHIIISADRPKDPNASRYLENTASTRGKPSFTAEAGYAGTVMPADVNALVNGSLNVMGYLKMISRPVVPVAHPVWVKEVKTIAAESDGIFYPTAQRGQHVAKGARIGYITDYFGKTVQEATAPAAGIILYVCAVPSMTKGETIANVGVVGKP